MESRIKDRGRLIQSMSQLRSPFGLAERIHLLSGALETAGLAVIGCSQDEKINDI